MAWFSGGVTVYAWQPRAGLRVVASRAWKVSSSEARGVSACSPSGRLSGPRDARAEQQVRRNHLTWFVTYLEHADECPTLNTHSVRAWRT